MNYLLRISYGPVQSFISAARKTQDLKAGSDLLVVLGREMIKSITTNDGQAEPIFPASEEADCANILQMVVSGNPTELARRARAAATHYLIAEVGKLERIDQVAARAQAERFLEFFAAWVPMGPNASRELGAKMAARKAIRDFESAPSPSMGEPAGERRQYPPKSPLLPEFDSVVPLDRTGLRVLPSVAGRYHLGERECLDAISLVKRSKMTRFDSTRAIAVKDVESLLTPEARPVFDEAKALLKDTNCDIGDWLFDQVEPETEKDREVLTPEVLNDLKAKRKTFMQAMKDVEDFRLRPYYAVIHADGDHMGRALEKLTEVNQMQDFSRKLDKFSQLVKEELPTHKGVVVFAGGDDVLAMVPIHRAMECARCIHEAFTKTMGNEADGPTLSLGIAIVHVTEDLREAVAGAKQMEKHAKDNPGKDSIAIMIRNRGGGEVKLRKKWSEAGQIEELILQFKSKDTPRGFPYEIRDAAMALKHLGEGIPDWTIRGTYQRIANKKEKAVVPELPESVDDADKMAAFADEMIVAHFMTRGGQEN